MNWLYGHPVEALTIGLLAYIAYLVAALGERAKAIAYDFRQVLTRLEVIEFTLQSIDARAERVNPENDRPWL